MKCKTSNCPNEAGIAPSSIWCRSCESYILAGPSHYTSSKPMKCKTSNCSNLMGSANGFCGDCNATPINPSHYQGAGMQAIDVIEAFKLGYNLGNVIKYVLRAGKKDDRNQDLDKAIAYLWRERYGTWKP